MIGGTTLGEMDSHPPREFKEPRCEPWGPLWRAAATTKVVVLAWLSAAAGEGSPLQVTLGESGPHRKNGKNQRNVGT